MQDHWLIRIRRKGSSALNCCTAPPCLPDAEDDARPEAQQVLFVPLAIGELCTQVVSLDGAAS
jgi:hypothetical protein